MVIFFYSRISTPRLKHNGPICLEFWYYMYGADIPEGALQVYLRNVAEGQSEAPIWSASGDHGPQWIQFKQTVFGVTQDISVSIMKQNM